MKTEYIPPSPNGIRTAIKARGLTGSATAQLCKVNPRTVRRWTGGDIPIPYAAWRLILDIPPNATIEYRVRRFEYKQTLLALQAGAKPRPSRYVWIAEKRDRTLHGDEWHPLGEYPDINTAKMGLSNYLIDEQRALNWEN